MHSFPHYESESRSVVSDFLRPHGFYSPWNSPDQNTGVGSHFFLQGIFPTQRLNQGLLHGRWILYQLSYYGSPSSLSWFSSAVPCWLMVAAPGPRRSNCGYHFPATTSLPAPAHCLCLSCLLGSQLLTINCTPLRRPYCVSYF